MAKVRGAGTQVMDEIRVNLKFSQNFDLTTALTKVEFPALLSWSILKLIYP
jgi:hypothetical protein